MSRVVKFKFEFEVEDNSITDDQLRDYVMSENHTDERYPIGESHDEGMIDDVASAIKFVTGPFEMSDVVIETYDSDKNLVSTI